MLTNDELLREIAGEGRYTFIATGMSTFDEIDHAVQIFEACKCEYELMHCHSTYPMAEEDANLKLIHTLSKRYGCRVGYSGHEAGTFVSTCAVAAGAASVERHITLDRNMYGSDQRASIEPYELCRLVKDIRDAEDEFFRKKWFDHIIICAKPETPELVFLFSPGGEEQHRIVGE